MKDARVLLAKLIKTCSHPQKAFSYIKNIRTTWFKATLDFKSKLFLFFIIFLENLVKSQSGQTKKPFTNLCVTFSWWSLRDLTRFWFAKLFNNSGLNPIWHRRGYFYPLVLFVWDFVSWFFFKNFQTFWR